MNELRDRLLELIKAKGACRRQKVVLSSGKTSDFYFDGKALTLDPEGLYLVASLILSEITPGEVTAIGGPTMGADPIAAACAVLTYQLGWSPPLRAFLVRKQAKEHGLRRDIEGYLLPGEKVAVVEDVITTGSSVKEAVGKIESAGARVAKIICLLDRQEGAQETLTGYRLISLLRREELQAG